VKKLLWNILIRRYVKMIGLIKNMFKADLRQKSLLFWDWLFPFLLMIGVSLFLKGGENGGKVLGGLMAFLMLQSLIFAIPFRITEYKSKGIMQLVVEEGNTKRFILSFLLMRVIVVLLQVFIFMPFGALMLGAEININILELVTVMIVGIFSIGGISLLLGLLCKTQQTALGLAQLVYLLLSVTSGIFYPLEQSPEVINRISIFSPITYLNKLLGNCLTGQIINLSYILGLGFLGIITMIMTVTIFSKVTNNRVIINRN